MGVVPPFIFYMKGSKEMVLPQEFIDKVKDTVDLVKLVEEYTELKKVGPYTYQGHCPNPKHRDSTPSFRVFKKGYKNGNSVNQYDTWACMGCHNGKKTKDDKNVVKTEKAKEDKIYGSDAIAFIQWIDPDKRSWRKAIFYLAEKYHIPIPTDENEAFYKNNKMIAHSLMYNMYGEPLEYLKKRGLTIEDCDEWMLGFDGKRITFPLMDRYRNILGFTRRWLHIPDGANDKYKNSAASEIFNKSVYLYGIHRLDMEFDEIRITEGPMDAILATKFHAKNVVATLGTAFTDGHIDLIRHYGKIPVFIMDSDEAGMKAVDRAISNLASQGIYSKLLILPSGKDLADMAGELGDELEDYIQREAITYGTYIIKDIISSYTSKVNELKLQYIPNLRTLINFVPGDEKIVIKSLIKNNIGIDIDG